MYLRLSAILRRIVATPADAEGTGSTWPSLVGVAVAPLSQPLGLALAIVGVARTTYANVAGKDMTSGSRPTLPSNCSSRPDRSRQGKCARSPLKVRLVMAEGSNSPKRQTD